MNNLNFGIIGNCKSAALISDKGDIQWCCLPDFDSPFVFGALLDEQKGGSFGFCVSEDYKITQQYLRDTNILVTTYTKGQDVFRVYDFMPRYKLEKEGVYCQADLHRYLQHVSGTPLFSVSYNPQLEYAKGLTKNNIHKQGKYIKSHTSNGESESIYLYSSLNLEDIVTEKNIKLKEDAFFTLSYHQKLIRPSLERCYLKLERTKVYWLNWVQRSPQFKDYQEQITRSSLTLKMLSYDDTGAILAAVTSSLPETIGEVRNWDYRFCWLRDASMAIRVMNQLNHPDLAKKFVAFVNRLLPEKNTKIQIMYGIHGETKLTETFLDHLSGYEGSSPVRIGNAAYDQQQNDIYGVLLDVLHEQFTQSHMSLSSKESLWTIVRSITKIVSQCWQQADRGIWEIRNNELHFTHSKVMCWVAVDRAIKIAELIHVDEYVELWSPLREQIQQDIHQQAWNEELQAFTQSYGSKALDAANLLMASYGFIDAKDPKFVGTVRATQNELCHEGLMYRYKNEDDFGLPSSSFTICTFWMINALSQIGEEEQAKQMFDRLLSYSNHLGLFSEDIDFKSKRLLGNFPQAYSHLALIEAAMHFTTSIQQNI